MAIVGEEPDILTYITPSSVTGPLLEIFAILTFFRRNLYFYHILLHCILLKYAYCYYLYQVIFVTLNSNYNMFQENLKSLHFHEV
jgi:hypothetical protein